LNLISNIYYLIFYEFFNGLICFSSDGFHFATVSISFYCFYTQINFLLITQIEGVEQRTVFVLWWLLWVVCTADVQDNCSRCFMKLLAYFHKAFNLV